MKSAILPLVHVSQAAFGIYNLHLASISINNLQGYEDMSKKAAKYSNTAEQQLHKTRTTQASGTIALFVSVLSSIYLLFGSPRTAILHGILGLNLVVLVAARNHVGQFWKQKARVPLPGVGDYNEATKNTQEVRLNMAYLLGSWVVVGALNVLF
ncbi:hypothetical protein BKA64DRAFT_710743 [Cadophora sp. MPI-SDFR-AT-0126]|nr:hypothetical protein BKA64DRAFT_710743 [Leotiomycetes sp. MPI-SDFR-AT-0126]